MGRPAKETPISQETLIYGRFCMESIIFSKLRGRACEKPNLSVLNLSFPVFSPVKECLMNLVKNFFCLALVLAASLLLIGCPLEEDDPAVKIPVYGLLHGTWVGQYGERFIINLNNNTFSHDFGDYVSFCYSAAIREIVKFNNAGTAGIIFIEYTNTVDWWSTTTGGNFTGVYFDNLTNTTVNISNAVDESAGYATPTTSSLTSAKALFTEGTIGDYFGMTSACVKQ